jgi:exodeoxyribonuclease V beta subunit
LSAPPLEEFDVCGPLPRGVTLLEASAGTGKTYAIAALVARYVAEGIPLGRLLVVTFTRIATGELRERVRDRLVGAEAGLARALAGVAPANDPVLELLARGTGDELHERRRRLADAVAGFDAATISTTHGFCQHALAGLGVMADVERDVTFVEDLSDLVEEVVDDLYVRRFRNVADPPIGRPEALRIGRAAVASPHARLAPVPGAGDEHKTWAMRWRLACAVRREVDARKRRAALMTYDDLLTRLRDTLADEASGPAACARLRERYAVALVDEFQDTDPVQWEIMRRAFGEGDATLVLIADPKQAIYSFRGADVYAYLAAARSAASTRTLATNWRSDQGLINALDALFGGAQLGHAGIVHRRVRAADAHREARLRNAPVSEPLRVRVLRREDGLVRVRNGFVVKSEADRLIARDVAADVVRTLSSAASVVSAESDPEPVRPRHVAVLVPTNWMAALVERALKDVGVAAVIGGAGSVFGTPAAGEWLRLLEAVERPSSDTRVRSAALTSFLGWTAAQLAAAGDPAIEELHAKLHRWAGVLRRRGVAALLDTIAAAESLPRRVLAQPAGERLLTDLGHIGQLLHRAAAEQQLGASALTAWLRQRIEAADRDTADEDRTLRLESDAEAVQVLTVHRSKGLEFPIVYLPYAWQPSWIDRDEPPAYHDDEHGDEWTIDVGADGPSIDHHRWLHLREERGEDLRLLYVALTRTMHQAVVWWAGTWAARNSALARLLLARGADGAVAPAMEVAPGDDEIAAAVEALAAEVPGRIAVETVETPSAAPWADEPWAAVELDASAFDRSLDSRWRRFSYSALVAGAHEPQVATEPEQELVLDEVLPAVVTSAAAVPDTGEEESLPAVTVPLAAMAGGLDVGDLVHRVLESTNFAAPDLEAELAVRLDEQQRRREVEIGDPAVVIDGLRRALETPLGRLVGDLRLCDVARADRADELAFELPLVGGDTPTGTLALTDVASLLEEHLPAGDPVGRYAERLRDPLLRWDLRGYLTGTLDLVLRARRDGGPARFVLVDYKTNWLGAEGEELTAWHYRPAALAEAMERAHYPLQALLYLVALHRYLRARLPAYDPAEHVAGVLYLFLRGMRGPDTPRVDGVPCGVFSWRPPAPLVEALSDLLDRGAVAA